MANLAPVLAPTKDNSFNGSYDVRGRYRKMPNEISKKYGSIRKDEKNKIPKDDVRTSQYKADIVSNDISKSPSSDKLPSPLLPDRVLCYDNMAVDFTEGEKKLPLYDDVTEMSEVKQWSGENQPTAGSTWFANFPNASSDSEKTAASLLEALKLSSMQEAMRPSYDTVEDSASNQEENKPKMQLFGNEFEDLKYEMIQRYGLTKNPTSTSSVTQSTGNDVITTSSFTSAPTQQPKDPSPPTRRRPKDRIDVAPSPPPYAGRRDIAAIASKYNYVPGDGEPSSIAIPRPTSRPNSGQLPRRSLSVNSTSGSDIWADIPPLVPPREPVRPSRISPSLNLSNSFGSNKSSKDTSPVEPPRTTASQTSSKACTASVFSAVPPSSTSNPVILPIIRNGVQDSHTHYFLLSDKQASKFKRSTSCSVPSARVAPFTSTQQQDISTVPKSPSSSRVRRTYSHLTPSQKAQAVQREVFGVTDEECRKALAMNSMDVPKAINYLKIEQLFCIGIMPRDKCQQILQATGWDLEMASSIVFEEYRREASKAKK